jgi:hypothetical protein
VRFLRWRLTDLALTNPTANLPESRVWELIPSFHPQRLVAGARWTDTIGVEAERLDVRQSLRGVRVSMLERDTIVDGQPMWLVRDSAQVTYVDQVADLERTLGTTARVERRGNGIIRGRYLFDPSLRVYRQRFDTTRLVGQATLRYEDGRSFTTPVRFERMRRFTLLAPATLRARAQAQDSIRRQHGMLYGPPGPIEERLAAADTALRDSLRASGTAHAIPWSVQRTGAGFRSGCLRGSASRESFCATRCASAIPHWSRASCRIFIATACRTR